MATSENKISTAPQQIGKRPSFLRRLVWLGSGFFLLVIVGVLFLPRVVSVGGASFIADQLSGQLGGPVQIDSVELSWTGEQRIWALRIGALPGAPVGEDLFRWKSATVKAGLLDLVGDDALVVEVVEPAIRVHRDREGRFNFEHLVPLLRRPKERRECSEDEMPPEKPPKDRPKTERRGGLSLQRDVVIQVTGASLEYHDELLGSRASLSAIDVQAALMSQSLEAQVSAMVDGSESTDGGRIQMRSQVRGLEHGTKLNKWQVEAEGEVHQLDLRPYRGLLEEFVGVTPPERAVDGGFTVSTGSGVLQATAHIAAGYATVETLKLTLPLEGTGGENSTASFTGAVDLGAVTVMPVVRESLAGKEVHGRINADLSLRGLPSVAELMAGLDMPLDQLAADVRLRGSNVRVTVEEESDKQDGKEPLVIEDDAVAFNLKIAPEGGDLNVSEARFTGFGTDARLVGHVRRLKRGLGKCRVELSGRANAALAEIIALLSSRWENEEIDIDEGTRLLVRDLVFTGDFKRGELADALRMTANLRLRGAVRHRGYEVKAFRSRMRLKDGSLMLKESTARINGGSATSELVLVRPFDDPPTYKLDIDIERVEANYELAEGLAYVLPFLSLEQEADAELKGLIHSSLKIDGAGFSQTELSEHLKGEGKLRVRAGRVDGSRFLTQLGSLVGLAEDGSLFVSEMGSDFTLGGGRIDAGKVFLQAAEGSKVRNLGLHGTTWLDGRVEYGVSLAALRETIGDKKIRRILSDIEEIFGSTDLPLKLTGTLKEPKLSFVTSQRADGRAKTGGVLREVLDLLTK